MNAAPVVFRDPSTMPAPGYTDGKNIYVADNLSRKERDVVIRHEQGHIWLWHFRRRKLAEVHFGDKFAPESWVLAQELEIARVLYRPEDERVVTAPRSRLNGGVLADTGNVPPKLLTVEEIYDWLVANAEPAEAACNCCRPGQGDEADPQDGEPYDIPSLVADAIQAAKEYDQAQKSSQLTTDVAKSLASPKPPSLASELDAVLRTRVVRERSFRRPSRRPSNGYIVRGAISTPRPPRITVYVDRSGSFDPSKTKLATERLHQILARYGASIRFDTFFFGDNRISQTDPGSGSGNTPYQLVVDQINAEQAEMAIVITDDDSADGITPVFDARRMTVMACGSDRTSLAKVAGCREV